MNQRNIIDQQKIQLGAPNNEDRTTIAIIGAGISGLCVAHWLKLSGIDSVVLEKDSEPGGTMKTLHDGEWLIETGPNSALETTPLLRQLFESLGISDRMIYADDAASKRYVLRNGHLHPIPMSPWAFIKTKLWTTTGKLRLLKEPFIDKSNKEETVAEFVQRRLGREFLDYAINPFVAGVYAGDPEKLSIQAAFPKLYALEEKYGGLLKGAIRSRKERKQRKEIAKDRAKLFSFLDGMQVLPNKIAHNLGKSLRLDSTVEKIIPKHIEERPAYVITYNQNGIRKTLEADLVVLATPARSTMKIIHDIDPGISTTIGSIYYPPVAEVFLGYRTNQIHRLLDGFGFLVPEIERRTILGTIWSSSLFPRRSPNGHAALTTFVGGARQPDLVMLSDEELINLVEKELSSLMNIEGKALYKKIIRWEAAIPQYNLGYQKIIDTLERFEQNFRGIFICSNFRGGIAVGDCVMSAEKTVTKIMDIIKENK